jgi:hypothetical protein
VQCAGKIDKLDRQRHSNRQGEWLLKTLSKYGIVAFDQCGGQLSQGKTDAAFGFRQVCPGSGDHLTLNLLRRDDTRQ